MLNQQDLNNIEKFLVEKGYILTHKGMIGGALIRANKPSSEDIKYIEIFDDPYDVEYSTVLGKTCFDEEFPFYFIKEKLDDLGKCLDILETIYDFEDWYEIS